jgi:hypothetical protein
MVQLIVGLKGSGKTKKLVDLVRAAVNEETGDVVCIEKERKLTFDIPYQARLIDAGTYDIGSYEFLKGLICGVHAGNYDITHFFIDNFYKLVNDKSVESLETFLAWLDKFSANENISFVISLSVDAETLSDKPLATLENVVADLLPPGLTILGGAPKVGKSWLMLDLCNHVANGEPFWGNEVRQGSTLYLCLEDTPRRLQNRINTITDSPSPASFLATEALSLAGGLCEQIRAFAAAYPDLVLVVIDTL